ncbi:hypothetical protein ACSBR2_034230 [Camellia fascicularis]
MAGLQYKFFPTDFFFPPQQSVNNTDVPLRQVLPIKPRKIDDINGCEQPITPIINDKHLKAPPSSSLPISPIGKENQSKLH